jgi:hypothetical protein
MSPNPVKGTLKTWEKVVLPFHHMNMVLILISSLSIHALLTNVFEPIKNVYVTFLLTFPFTLGLTIIFLILANYDWKKLTFFKILEGLSLFAILFIILAAISNACGLPIRPNTNDKSPGQKTQKIVPPVHSSNGIEGAKDLAATYDSAQNNSSSKGIVNKLPGILIFPMMLVGYLIEFYKEYGAGRFISGIALALFFAYYFQTKIVNRFFSGKPAS